MSTASPDKENCAAASMQLKPLSSPKAKRGSSGGGVLAVKKAAKIDGNGSSAKVSFVTDLLENVKVGKEVNKEEDTVFEVRAVPYRMQLRSDDIEGQKTYTGGWIKSAAGPLKLYRHKTTGKTRLVQRNRIGTVKLTLSIGGGVTELEKVVKEVTKKGQKPKEVAYVGFVAKVDEETGWEVFLLKVKPAKVDALYFLLKGMGAGVKRERLEP